MFGLSTTEVLIILAVALIFVGPEQLPKVARQIGKGVRQVRGAVGKVDDEMRRAVREAAAEFDDDGERVEPRAKPEVPKPEAPKPEAEASTALPPGDALPVVAPDPAHAPPITHETPIERDWSQVGKTRAPGTVARLAAAAPGRPALDPAPPAADAPDAGPRPT